MKNLKWICVLILFLAILQSYIINSENYNYIINRFFSGQVLTEEKKKSNSFIKDKKFEYIFKYNPPKNLLENGVVLQILFFIIGLNLKIRNSIKFKEKVFLYS